MKSSIVISTTFAAIALLTVTPSRAELSSEELAKLAQNPVGNLISVPFQNNSNLNFGPERKTQNVLNVQPVIPIGINNDWNVITRTIVPVISMPELSPTDNRTNGIGDTVFSAFLSPAKPTSSGIIWGAGPVIQAPTHNRDQLGNKNWGAGPTAVILRLQKGNPWVYGALFNNIWSVSDNKTGGAYNNLTLQPFLNYNFPDGTYLTSSPVITANWRADNSDRWTVPLGGGIGKIFHFGRLPVNAQVAAYYNVVSPDNAANWQIRAQVQFMFPK